MYVLNWEDRRKLRDYLQIGGSVKKMNVKIKTIMNTGILILIIGVLLAIMSRFGNNSKTEFKTEKPIVEINQTEIDSAVNFGYKTVWLALKAGNKKRVSELLKLQNTKECNWEVGISESYNSSIYITPQNRRLDFSLWNVSFEWQKRQRKYNFYKRNN